MATKALSIALPEYTVDEAPDYIQIGRQVDDLLAEQLGDGAYLIRALSLAEHPGKSLDELGDIILELGTDKYDPNRKEVEKNFGGYDHEFHVSSVQIKDGQLFDEEGTAGDTQLAERVGLPAEECAGYFGALSYHFRESLPLARGVSLRADILTIYDPEQMQQAEWVDPSIPEVGHFAQHLYKFKEPERKQQALVALVKIG
ncbi:MAG: hypothetical protein GKR89_06890 [Candidatus Latescibacteria bacterium]|nr:hypothetical protein [Candidatus Latescibacterota bacterium]